MKHFIITIPLFLSYGLFSQIELESVSINRERTNSLENLENEKGTPTIYYDVSLIDKSTTPYKKHEFLIYWLYDDIKENSVIEELIISNIKKYRKAFGQLYQQVDLLELGYHLIDIHKNILEVTRIVDYGDFKGKETYTLKLDYDGTKLIDKKTERLKNQ